ncbi:hypothetical protein BLNAU_11475 [Blattamonas nauphoetae]|uniref:Uncharacterized protein n=1 Tax=Blattamonas nauphoetae TaxID=2049346 RepID=A0ABQ9XNI5_9EUKA|nr:hypothetical protein BLNAU_11475 [Blattamonas nauphoetae]
MGHFTDLYLNGVGAEAVAACALSTMSLSPDRDQQFSNNLSDPHKNSRIKENRKNDKETELTTKTQNTPQRYTPHFQSQHSPTSCSDPTSSSPARLSLPTTQPDEAIPKATLLSLRLPFFHLHCKVGLPLAQKNGLPLVITRTARSNTRMESPLSSTIPRPTLFVTPPKHSAHLVFSPSHSLTHSLPKQPQLRLTTPPSRHPPPLNQPALRRLGRLSPIFTCGTRGGRFAGSDSESEMTLCVDEALVVSNILSLLEILQCDDEHIIVDTLRELQKVASGVVVLAWNHSALKIAHHSLQALQSIVRQNPPAFALLLPPIFPSPSPLQQYSGLSFLTALTKKLRIVDSEIIQELIHFVKEALTTILANISNIDTLIASLPSDSSPTTPCLTVVDIQMIDSLNRLRCWCEDFVNEVWLFLVNFTFTIHDIHESSFQTIVLDDLSFPDLILNSLRRNHKDIRLNAIMTLNNIVIVSEWMRLQFIAVNLVERMFETVDFVSLPLSESETLLKLTKFIANLFYPIVDDEEARFEQYCLIRVSVFEPTKRFITFIFHNSDKLILDEEDTKYLETCLCWIHRDIKNKLVKWEVRTMVEMENEMNFQVVFKSMLDRTREWNRDKRERQKRREVRLREEGWDDVFELRVVGIEAGRNLDIRIYAILFRIELVFNSEEL